MGFSLLYKNRARIPQWLATGINGVNLSMETEIFSTRFLVREMGGAHFAKGCQGQPAGKCKAFPGFEDAPRLAAGSFTHQ